PIVRFGGGSTLSARALLFAGPNEGVFTTNGSSGALFFFNGGSHTLATGPDNAIDLRGSSTKFFGPGNEGIFIDDGGDPPGFFVSMTLATDRPLKHDGSLIDVDNATVTAAN